MDDSLQDHDLLIRYLDGDLTPSEKLVLEQRLLSDNAFRLQLQNLQVAVQALRQFGITQQVNTIHQEIISELKGKRKGKVVPFQKVIQYIMAVAASTIILFIGFRLYMNTQASPDKIYNEAFVDFNLSATRGSEITGSAIEKLYQQKNHAAVTTTTRSRILSAKDSLLIGLSYLHTKKSDKAVQFFEQIANANSNYQQDAEFYLSLAYLRERRFEKAAALMKKIGGDPTHLYHAQITKELLEDVEKLEKK